MSAFVIQLLEPAFSRDRQSLLSLVEPRPKLAATRLPHGFIAHGERGRPLVWPALLHDHVLRLDPLIRLVRDLCVTLTQSCLTLVLFEFGLRDRRSGGQPVSEIISMLHIMSCHASCSVSTTSPIHREPTQRVDHLSPSRHARGSAPHSCPDP